MKSTSGKPVQKLVLALSLLAALPLAAARPVARWDVVPFQRIEGVFNAGVVAFHDKAVKVRFTVNGQAVHTAEKPEKNPRTGVLEHVLPLDVSKYEDGPLTIGAIALADGEEGFKLPFITLYANSRHTQGSHKKIWVDPKKGNDFSTGAKNAPVMTLKRAVALAGDGGTVYLTPGEYTAKTIGGGRDRNFWTTIQPSPGCRRSQVKIGAGRTGTDKLRFRFVELFCDVADDYGKIIMGEGGSTMGWFDGCKMYNKQGRWSGKTEPFGNKLRAFVTGGETTEMSCGPDAELVRAHALKAIAHCAFKGGGKLVANCTVNDLDAGDTDCEAEFYKAIAFAPNQIDDVIICGVDAKDCKAKAVSCARIFNSAFVDMSIETEAGATTYSHFSNAIENVLFKNVKISGQKWVWMQKPNGKPAVMPRDVRLVDCDIEEMTGFAPLDGSNGILVTKTK